MMDEDVAFPGGGEHVPLVPVLTQQARLRHRGMWGIAQLAEARQADQTPKIREVEGALGVIQLPLVDRQRVAELASKPLAHPLVDLEPNDLAEAAAAKLL